MTKLIHSFITRDFWHTAISAVAILAATAWIAFQFVQPAPPKKVVMSSGAEGGAYDVFAHQYRDILARDGIELVLRPSAGSVQNLELLKDASSGVSIAFVQGGIAQAEDDEELMSLASLYYEPMWVFYRGAPDLDRLTLLRGKRIAIGPAGSGTRPLALQLLKLAGVDEKNAKFSNENAGAATEALAAGRIDAAFIIGSPESPVVKKLMHTKSVKLMNLALAEAYTRYLPFLSRVVLPQGGIDIVENTPPRDVHLIAPTANLLVRDDIHPALVNLLLQAATEIHSGAGLLRRAGDFPSAKGVDIPLSLEAERFLKSGPPFLQKHLPFWLAVLIDRLIVMLIPILAVLIPLVKFTPSVYAWRVKSRIYRWYGKLKVLEIDMETAKDPLEVQRLVERLEEIEYSVSQIPTPLAFSDYLYNLRSHIELIRAKLAKRLQPGA